MIRRALWPRTRLHDGLSQAAQAAQAPPPRLRAAPSLRQSRRYASVITDTQGQISLPVTAENEGIKAGGEGEEGGGGDGQKGGKGGKGGKGPSTLDVLLMAVQRKDTAKIRKQFVMWTNLLAEDSPEDKSQNGEEQQPAELRALARQQAQELPSSTLSEILRGIDPTASAHDIAQGLFLTQGQTQFIDLSSVVNPFGVRRHHRRIVLGMEALMKARAESRLGLLPHDYDVFMRCAGAAMDYHRAKTFWTAMAAHGLSRARTAASWTEFIKARFATEPLYYQFDKTRVAVMARDLYTNRSTLPLAAIKRLDRLRLSLNAVKPEQLWNRRPDQPDEDLRRLFRRRRDYRAFKNHWIRSAYYGHEMDEELLCASMVSFARSSSLALIRSLILQQYYGVTIANVFDPSRTEISGGHDFPRDSLVRPTVKFLNALVEAFGCMSHIALGSRLLDYFSKKYDIPIPHATWSRLLSWTYVCASKPFTPMRRIHGSYASTAVSSHDVRQIWDFMTSPSSSITPTLDDVDCYIRVLILQRQYHRAVSAIEQRAIPLYEGMVRDYEAALFDEILQRDAAHTRSASNRNYNIPAAHSIVRAVQRRKRAQLLKDRAHQRIASLFERVLKTAGRNASHRTGAFAHVVIPRLVLSFPDFFYAQVRYRTSQGEVVLHRPDVVERFTWEPRFRVVEAQKVGGFAVRGVYQGADQADFRWPMTHRMRVRGWRRRPAEKKTMDPAPVERDRDPAWWDELERQLML